MDEVTQQEQSDDVDRDAQMDLEEETEHLPPQRKSTKQPTGKKRSRRQIQEEEEDSLLKRAVTALDKATASPHKVDVSADDIFGQYVASELKGIKDGYVKKLIKHKIQTVIFESQVPTMPHRPLSFNQAHFPVLSPTSHTFDQTVAPFCDSSPRFSTVVTPQGRLSSPVVRPTSAPASTLQTSPPSPALSEYSTVTNACGDSFTVLF